MRKIFMVLTIFIMVFVLAGAASAVVDTDAGPKPIAGDPARNAVNVPVDKEITTTFNENIDFGSGGEIFLVKKGGNKVATTNSIAGNVLTVTPTAQLEKATTYTLVLELGSLINQDGNANAYYSRPFTTDSTAPKATAGSPARNAVNVPVDTVITTTFNENIQPGPGKIYLIKKGGSEVDFTTSINGKILTITPTAPLVKSTQYIFVLGAASLKDMAGNPISAYSRPFTTDSTGPKAIAGSPARNAVNVPVDTVITTTFNEKIQAGPGEILLVKKGGSKVAITTSITGNVLTVTPTAPLVKATMYTLVLEATSLKDMAGNSIAAYSRPFTIDSTAPKARSGSPARNAVNVPINTQIVTRFNENILAGTGKILLIKKGGGEVAITTSIDGKILTVTPTAPLQKATTYTLVLQAGSLKDMAGNSIAAYSRPFTTDSTAPKAIAGSPARNAINVPVDAEITTTFNELIKYGAGAIQLLNQDMDLVAITHAINGNVLTVTPTAPLLTNSGYILLLYPDSITDMAGNGIEVYARGFITTLTF